MTKLMLKPCYMYIILLCNKPRTLHVVHTYIQHAVTYINCNYSFQEKFDIDRKHTRSILRVLKRNPLRATLWQKRTLRKSLFLGKRLSCNCRRRSSFKSFFPPLPTGQAVFPLEKLETRSELRANLDHLDEKGRKPVGGKMELVARLREPFTGITPHSLTHPPPSRIPLLPRERYGREGRTVAGVPRTHSSDIIGANAPPLSHFIPRWPCPFPEPGSPFSHEGGEYDQCRGTQGGVKGQQQLSLKLEVGLSPWQ